MRIRYIKLLLIAILIPDFGSVGKNISSKSEKSRRRQELWEEELYKCFISLIMRSSARVCVIPMQDYMGLDNRFRMNKPSTVGTNWKWRIKKRDLTKKLQKEIHDVTLRYGRKNWD